MRNALDRICWLWKIIPVGRIRMDGPVSGAVGNSRTAPLEHFRFKCCACRIVKGGFLLGKKPLGFEVPVKSRIENAVTKPALGVRGLHYFCRETASYIPKATAPPSQTPGKRTVASRDQAELINLVLGLAASTGKTTVSAINESGAVETKVSAPNNMVTKSSQWRR